MTTTDAPTPEFSPYPLPELAPPATEFRGPPAPTQRSWLLEVPTNDNGEPKPIAILPNGELQPVLSRRAAFSAIGLALVPLVLHAVNELVHPPAAGHR